MVSAPGWVTVATPTGRTDHTDDLVVTFGSTG